MNLQPSPERREKILKLRAYVKGQADGTRLGYLDVEIATGIKMNTEGKNLFRSAMHAELRPWLAIPGFGVELSSPKNGLEIVGGKVKRIAGAIKKAGKTALHVSDRHRMQMSGEDVKKLTYMEGALGAFNAARQLKGKF